LEETPAIRVFHHHRSVWLVSGRRSIFQQGFPFSFFSFQNFSVNWELIAALVGFVGLAYLVLSDTGILARVGLSKPPTSQLSATASISKSEFEKGRERALRRDWPNVFEYLDKLPAGIYTQGERLIVRRYVDATIRNESYTNFSTEGWGNDLHPDRQRLEADIRSFARDDIDGRTRYPLKTPSLARRLKRLILG
jgi:hypothetical protein